MTYPAPLAVTPVFPDSPTPVASFRKGVAAAVGADFIFQQCQQVDLPQPFLPTRPTFCPGLMVRWHYPAGRARRDEFVTRKKHHKAPYVQTMLTYHYDNVMYGELPHRAQW